MQEHPEFINLFNKCFNTLLTYNEFKKDNNLHAQKLYDYQMKVIADNGITDKELSQYILLKSLYKGAFKPLFNKEIYIQTIEYLRAKAVNNEIKNISNLALKKIRYLSKGYACPFIKGKDYKSNIINTKDYEGKYHYMMFFERYSRMIDEELNIVASIADKKDYLQISIICNEKQRDKILVFLKKYRLDDNAIFCDNYETLKSQFRVIATPSYFFVDKEANIIQSHTIKPNEKLIRTLTQIYNQEVREAWKAKNQYFK
jgi:hypothetical protein